MLMTTCLEVGEEVIGCFVERRTEDEIRVRVPPTVAQEEFKRVTNGVNGACPVVVRSINDKIKFAPSV